MFDIAPTQQHSIPSQMSPSQDQPQPGLPASVRRVFISYAHEDQPWAEERARVAENLDWTVFFDQASLRAGDIWPDVLLTSIAEADRVWLGWSKYAAQSDWVKREYTAALAKEPGRLFIDRLDDTPLPDELKHIQAEKWTFARPAADDLIRDPKEDIATGPLRPGRLLHPKFAVVPFAGRDALVQEIRTWCISDAPFQVALYTGPGGVGKTRLFIEICEHLRADGWDAGFLHRENFEKKRTADPDLVDTLLHPRLPRLMVLDYAETRRKQVEALFQRAVDKKTGKPIRVVLLARSEGDWWENLLDGSYAFEELVGDGAAPHPLPPLAPDLDARHRIFETAASTCLRRVLDYAETRRKQVEALFQRAVDKKTGKPIRVVLLARSEGDWWENLLDGSYAFEELVGDGAGARRGFLSRSANIFERTAGTLASFTGRILKRNGRQTRIWSIRCCIPGCRG